MKGGAINAIRMLLAGASTVPTTALHRVASTAQARKSHTLCVTGAPLYLECQADSDSAVTEMQRDVAKYAGRENRTRRFVYGCVAEPANRRM